MKILPAVAVLQLFLVITDAGSSLPVERKRVACYFYNFMTAKCGSISPEDIPASLCTHLMVDYQFLKMHPDEIEGNWMRTPDIDGNIQKLAKLKEANPDLKLLLQIPHPSEIRRMYGLSPGSPEIKNFTIEYLAILKTIGFDGLDFVILSFVPDLLNELAESFCEIKTEFDKYGFVITTTLMENPFDYFWRSTYETNHSVSNLARTSSLTCLSKEDFRQIMRIIRNSSLEWIICRDEETKEPYALTRTTLCASYEDTTSMEFKKSNVDLFSSRGLPLDKILITILTTGNIYTLANSKETALGTKVSGPGHDNSDLGSLIYYKEARYVMEKGLAGIEVDNLDTDKDGGAEGDGRFPLTRAIHDTFAGRLQTTDTTN
ncbi:hypothetical protein J437_LFUL014761 [Ladona fulva]|uniref:GH18 domain-containing protein n=1 Tax=Ladona fulva TaxID=123851 RepID=A0A8K0KGC3_LADFU|nr:hypothetical protein J437_LFUL014761 [Ladona fulva]